MGAGSVHRASPFKANADVRLYQVAGRMSATAAHLFLHSCGVIDSVRMLRMSQSAHCLDYYRATNPVIPRLTKIVRGPVEPLELRIRYNRSSGIDSHRPDLFRAVCADVQQHRVPWKNPRTLFRRHYVDVAYTSDRFDWAFGPDYDPPLIDEGLIQPTP